MQDSLIEKIKIALSRALNGKEMQQISLDARLKEDLGLDSMTSLTFLLILEEIIDGFMVDPESLQMDDLITIQSVVSYVERSI